MLHRGLAICGLLWAVTSTVVAEDEKDGWKSLFDGKTFNGWKINENPDSWTVQDGMIRGKGDRSHLFTEEEFQDFEFKAEVMTAPGANSGMYFRVEFGPAWPKGYEAQVNNTHKDPRKTGSLYAISDVKEILCEDNKWWTQHIICQGNHIIIKVNDKVVVDYVDKENRFAKGRLGLQQHDPGSVVHYRNLMVKPLKAEKK